MEQDKIDELNDLIQDGEHELSNYTNSEITSDSNQVDTDPSLDFIREDFEGGSFDPELMDPENSISSKQHNYSHLDYENSFDNDPITENQHIEAGSDNNSNFEDDHHAYVNLDPGQFDLGQFDPEQFDPEQFDPDPFKSETYHPGDFNNKDSKQESAHSDIPFDDNANGIDAAVARYKEFYTAYHASFTEFANKEGYIRQKSEDEKAIHAAKRIFGSFNIHDIDGMATNTNNGMGVTVKLSDGSDLHFKSQKDLFEHVVRLNKEKGAFFDMDFIEKNNYQDFVALNNLLDKLDIEREILRKQIPSDVNKASYIESIEKDIKNSVRLEPNKNSAQQASNVQNHAQSGIDALLHGLASKFSNNKAVNNSPLNHDINEHLDINSSQTPSKVCEIDLQRICDNFNEKLIDFKSEFDSFKKSSPLYHDLSSLGPSGDLAKVLEKYKGTEDLKLWESIQEQMQQLSESSIEIGKLLKDDTAKVKIGECLKDSLDDIKELTNEISSIASELANSLGDILTKLGGKLKAHEPSH